MALAYLIGFFTNPLGPSSKLVDAGIFSSPMPPVPGETERRALMEAVEGTSFEQAQALFFKKLESFYPNKLEGLKRCQTFQRQFAEFKSKSPLLSRVEWISCLLGKMRPFRWSDLVPMVPPPAPRKGPYRCPHPLDLKAPPITPTPYVLEPPDPKHPYAMREGETIDKRMERFGYMKLSSGEYIPKEEMDRPHVPSYRARFALDCHMRPDPYENERQAVLAAVREDNERAALKRGW